MIKLNKDLLYQLLFALCIIIPYFNVYELTFGIWSIVACLTLRNRYSYTIIKFSLCFFAIIVIAFLSAIFYQHTNYNYLRDFTYLVKPIIGLLLGYQLCRSYNINPLKTIIYTGLIIAVSHLLIVGFSALKFKILNIHLLRQYGGYFSDYEVYALILVLFSNTFEVRISHRYKNLISIIIGTSVILYMSRTNFLQFFILYIYVKGYVKLNKRSIVLLGTIGIVTILFYTVLFNITLARNGGGLEALFFKIRNAPIESFKTRINKHDYKDFNDNYRSYENIITVRQVNEEGIPAVLFGKGLGATIDIGRKVWTNDGEYIRQIPVLHNGFTTVFLKSGLLGVLILIIFLKMLINQRKSDIYSVKQINLLLSGSGLFLILSTWVLLGLYLKIESKSILIGYILAYKEILVRRSQNHLTV